MLKDRETIILKHVVEDFVQTNRPVGSDRLSARLGLSPASIRNTMNALLNDGYLVQPHTSAGRAPSDTGYRYFVDYLLQEWHVAESETNAILECLDTLQARLDRMLRDVTRLLSGWADCLAFVSTPEIEQCEISRIDITRLSKHRALLILVLSNGMVETRLTPLPDIAGDLPLDRIAARLNERLYGRHVSAVSSVFLESIFAEIRLNEKNLCDSIRLFFRDLFFTFSRRVFVDGEDEIIGQPEFADSTLLRPVLEIVNEENPGSGIFTVPTGERVPEITIGGENAIEPLHPCSVIKSHFSFGDNTIGTIGVIGPKRMEYPRIVALVGHIAAALSRTLSDYGLR